MSETPRAAYDFNHDPAWLAYIATLEPLVAKIAMKYASMDDSLREDCIQEARIALATVHPERIEWYKTGDLADTGVQAMLERYLRNVIRNAVLSYLDSYSKGNWYVGRTRTVRDQRTGDLKKVYTPPRFASLDALTDEFGMQVGEDYEITWADLADDGLPQAETRPYKPRARFPWNGAGTEELPEA